MAETREVHAMSLANIQTLYLRDGYTFEVGTCQKPLSNYQGDIEVRLSGVIQAQPHPRASLP